MATIDYWIQLENRPWDASPNNIDRITGEDMKEVTTKDPVVDVTLRSPGTGVTTKRTMYNPLRKDDGVTVRDALILRRYRPPTLADESDAWTVPDDRKVNPWDLNEPDPTDNGTMGTIPGPVIECNVGDEVKVHFRNLDMRGVPIFIEVPFRVPRLISLGLPVEKRTHSLHPHGFVFAPRYDGAYPLSPPDGDQPVAGGPGLGPDETALWALVPKFRGRLKKGDRVPPGGTFTYTWKTLSWPTTAGVWLYHDHSICDVDNVALGAIGIIVIHNPADTEQEVDIRDPNDPTALDAAFLPGESPNGDPRLFICFPFELPTGSPFREIRVQPNALDGLGAHDEIPHGHGMSATALSEKERCESASPGEPELPVLARTIRQGDVLFELDEKLEIIIRICLYLYRPPPTKALYLQLFHTLKGGIGMDGSLLPMMINGRTFLGNTPTMVAGPTTRMRFGVVGMGDHFHTFHLHGHRWIIPGPDGNTVAAIQGSPQVTATSQFEDTKIFGPANSFVFTINEESGFMRAAPPFGEWHMHCHVLDHMMMGMMGSLLVVNFGDLVSPLPVGVPCGHDVVGDGDHNGNGVNPTHEVSIIDATANGFQPKDLFINVGDTVIWKNNDLSNDHTATWTAGPGDHFNTGTIVSGATSAPITFNGLMSNDILDYQCAFHTDMTGKIHVI